MFVINEAFILIQFKFQEIVDELLGMPGNGFPEIFPRK
jgi:hypothetical protein